MRITFRLQEERDADIIKWLESLPGDPGRSYVIRQALRRQIAGREAAPSQRVSFKPTPLSPEPAREPITIDSPMPEIDMEKRLDSLF